jgi:protein phosphatase
LAYLHERRIVLHELHGQQVALPSTEDTHTSAAKWADLAPGFVIPLEEWQRTGTRRIASDVRQLAALLYRLATGLTQYDADAQAMAPHVNTLFAHALGAAGFTTGGELAAALRQAKVLVRHPGGIDIHAARLSDVGRARRLDEDSVLTLELGQIYRSISMPLGIYAVADGMGGHQGGDVASQLAALTIARRAVRDMLIPALTDNSPPVDYEEWLRSVIQEANQVVLKQRMASRNDMGTTLVLAVVAGDTAHIAHLGDSRAYLIANGTINRLTTDHSLVERLVATGQISPQEAATHPQRNVIYRNIGDKEQVEPDITRQTLAPGNVLLLCCDGLSGEIADEEILRIVTESPSLPEATYRLVRAANDAGGRDNISVVLVGVRAVD